MGGENIQLRMKKDTNFMWKVPLILAPQIVLQKQLGALQRPHRTCAECAAYTARHPPHKTGDKKIYKGYKKESSFQNKMWCVHNKGNTGILGKKIIYFGCDRGSWENGKRRIIKDIFPFFINIERPISYFNFLLI